MPERATFRLKTGLAEMLKGGVIMDVTDAEQARVAEAAGACAVMALERVPADIRAQGGVSRLDQVIETVRAAGGLTYTSAQASHEKAQALACLANSPASHYRDAMETLIRFVVDRNF